MANRNAMTNRVTKLRTGPTAKRASLAIGSRGDVADRPVARRGIPLDLVPLLSPYKGKGRLTLRVERMPRAARLSAGRNNGDNSWSLTLDELEDLEYLPPEGSTNAHTLALRIVARDDDGASTLVVLDLPISPDTVGSSPAANLRGAPAVAVSSGDNTQARQLRDELAKAAAALAARESELAEAQQRTERAEAEIVLKDNALADALATRKVDTDARVAGAAAQAASDLERSRKAWQAEQNDRIVDLEGRAETRMAHARESWRREMQDALSEAESSWKAGEADRLAAAEKQWQAQANKALAEAQAGVDTLLKESETELRRLRDDLAQTRAIVAERDAELTRMRSASEVAHQREQEQTEAARSMAEATGRANNNEAERLAVAERHWQGEHGKHLAEAKARYEAAELALAEMGRRARQEGATAVKLGNELAVLQSILDSREVELARIHATFEADRRDTSDLITGQRRAAAWSDDGQEAVQSERSLVRDVVVVVGVVMALALIYFRIEDFLPEYLRIALPTIATDGSGPAVGSAAPEKPAPARASSIEHDTAVVTRRVNLRAGPSKAADVVATLPRGVHVEKIEQRGNWTRVQTRDKRDPSKSQQGWIYNSYIKVTGLRPEKSAVANHGQGRSP